uniref:Integrase, catalytic region, zinc finger, CCHC-type, peptidase aspartic, catalytic n=1 Tax=Tanacetum cinerariifolium TaxID=118510 RepID=A0A699Q8Y7_TANCI|nr:integrase, catalytic region, zinc finger, CCHC-type, peptidase aspartic, catalytic [Tanacetum cinerariifolium]
MDLCGAMRIASINGKRYVLVIVDDYSHYTWIHFLRSKDEALEVIIKFLKRILILLQSPVIIIRTDNGTEFKNQVLKEYFDTVGISHQMSSVRTPQQNGVVKRRNRTQGLHLLHIDLCGPMRIASINGKRYVLVIVDDYSRYTWSPVIIIRTDNGTEFKNQVLKSTLTLLASLTKCPLSKHRNRMG